MLKSDLIRELANENEHLRPEEVERLVAIVLEVITQSLLARARVELRGFGTFEPRYRCARKGRNPRTGEDVMVKAKHVPFFKPSRSLLTRLNKKL